LGMRIKPSSTKESNENCGIYLEKWSFLDFFLTIITIYFFIPKL
jgi:hypothetical protein